MSDKVTYSQEHFSSISPGKSLDGGLIYTTTYCIQFAVPKLRQYKTKHDYFNLLA